MSKSKLLLVNCFNGYINEDELKKYLDFAINVSKLSKIWVDPFVTPCLRAVALFEKFIDDENINRCTNFKGLEFKGKPLYCETVTQPQSIVVNTNGALSFGAPDKLRYLFSSKKYNGKKVTQVKPLQHGYFEIYFEDGWDAVLVVSLQSWEANNIKLAVCPYFDCFKETSHFQLKRLMLKNKQYDLPEEKLPKASIKDGRALVQDLAILKTLPSSDQIESKQKTASSTEKFNKVSSNVPRLEMSSKTAVKKKSTYFFRNKLFPLLLNVMDFETSVQTFCNELVINIDSLEMEAEIEGPEQVLKFIHQTLSCEELKFCLTELEIEFLTDTNIQEHLKALVVEKNWQLDMDKSQPGFAVTDKTGKKVLFVEFITSLVIVKSCSAIPNQDFQGSKDWISFVDLFKKSYPYRRIIVDNSIMKIISLSYLDNDLDLMVNVVNDKLAAIMNAGSVKGERNVLHSVSSIEDVTHVNKSTIYCHNKVFLWLLNILNLKDAISKKFGNIQMFISEDEYEIIIKAPLEETKSVKNIILSDKNKVFFKESGEHFLADAKVKQQIELATKRANWHIVLDGDTMMVKVENDDQMDLQTFASRMLVRENILSFPKAVYKESLQWMSFMDNFNAKEKTCQIYSSGESFTILSLPTENKETLDQKLCHINSHIESMMNSAVQDSSQMVSLKEKKQNSQLSNSSSEGKIKIKSLTLVSKCDFFMWLLDVLCLEQAVRMQYSDLVLNVDSLEKELHIKGCANDVEKLNSLILKLEGKISFTDEEELFLENEKVLQYVKSTIKKSGLHIELLKDKNTILLKDKNGVKIDFGEFVTPLISQKKCKPLPTINYQDNKKWRTFCTYVLSMTPPGQIFVIGRDVILYTVGNDIDSALLVSKVNEFIDNIDNLKESIPDDETYRKKDLENIGSNVTENDESSDDSVKQNTTSVKSMIARFDQVKNTPSKTSNTEQNVKSCKPIVQLKTSPVVTSELSTAKHSEKSTDKEVSEIYTVTTHHSTFGDSALLVTERKSYKIIRENVEKPSNLSRSASYNKGDAIVDVYPLSSQEHEFCKNFLQDSLNQLEKKYTADIKLNCQIIEIKCASQMVLGKIFEELKTLLHEIQFEDRLISYPGLLPFIESTNGKGLIQKLASVYKCMLEVPDFKLPCKEDAFQSLEYKVIVLGTAHFEGFNMHFVLGHERNVKVNMKLEFMLINEEECDIEPQRSGKKFKIKLPILHPSRTTEKIKSSFKRVIGLVIEQLKYLNCQSVAIATAVMQELDSTIYIEYLFEILPQELLNAFKSTKHGCDVYIVEPSSQAVFDTFVAVLKSLQVALEAPDQTSWDKISSTDSNKSLDYRALKTKLTVSSKNCINNWRKTLMCYPVLPSLDVSCSPVLNEPFCSQTLLQLEIQKFKTFQPKGFHVGDCLQLKSTEDDVDILLYCCPELGYDSAMAIHDALETILLNSSEFEYVHIVPPGFHVKPTFPKAYLSWKIFHTLDKLLPVDKYIFRQKMILLIVEDREYRQAFELELRKRYAKKQDYPSKVEPNKTVEKNSEKIATGSSPVCIKNTIPSTLVSFWGTSTESLNKAELFFVQHLDNLMKDMLVSLSFDKLSTIKIENIISEAQDVPVSLSLEKTFKGGSGNASDQKKPLPYRWRKRKKTGAEEKELVSSILQIQGLSEEFVKDFLKQIENIISIDNSS